MTYTYHTNEVYLLFVRSVFVHVSVQICQGQILAVWILAAKLPNSDLNFAVDLYVDLFLPDFPSNKAQTNQPKNPLQNSPGSLFGKIPSDFCRGLVLKICVCVCSGAKKEPQSQKIARTAPKTFLNNSRGLQVTAHYNKGFEANDRTRKFTVWRNLCRKSSLGYLFCP